MNSVFDDERKLFELIKLWAIKALAILNLGTNKNCWYENQTLGMTILWLLRKRSKKTHLLSTPQLININETMIA